MYKTIALSIVATFLILTLIILLLPLNNKSTRSLYNRDQYSNNKDLSCINHTDNPLILDDNNKKKTKARVINSNLHDPPVSTFNEDLLLELKIGMKINEVNNILGEGKLQYGGSGTLLWLSNRGSKFSIIQLLGLEINYDNTFITEKDQKTIPYYQWLEKNK